MAFSRVSCNSIAAIDHALPMRNLRNVLIPGTISKAIKLGEICRQAIAKGADSAAAVAAAGDGMVLFSGEVSEVTYATEEGFTIGEIALSDGVAIMAVSVKNENMVCTLDGVVVATIPDLICFFDKGTGEPIANPDVVIGQPVAVVILPAPFPFTTEKGLAIFGPTYAGVRSAFVSPLDLPSEITSE
jgi:DUF917 family protein